MSNNYMQGQPNTVMMDHPTALQNQNTYANESRMEF